MTYIFESPDNGITIYRRKFGCLKRELVSNCNNKENKEKINKKINKGNIEIKYEPANSTSVNFAWWYSQ